MTGQEFKIIIVFLLLLLGAPARAGEIEGYRGSPPEFEALLANASAPTSVKMQAIHLALARIQASDEQQAKFKHLLIAALDHESPEVAATAFRACSTSRIFSESEVWVAAAKRPHFYGELLGHRDALIHVTRHNREAYASEFETLLNTPDAPRHAREEAAREILRSGTFSEATATAAFSFLGISQTKPSLEALLQFSHAPIFRAEIGRLVNSNNNLSVPERRQLRTLIELENPAVLELLWEEVQSDRADLRLDRLQSRLSYLPAQTLRAWTERAPGNAVIADRLEGARQEQVGREETKDAVGNLTPEVAERLLRSDSLHAIEGVIPRLRGRPPTAWKVIDAILDLDENNDGWLNKPTLRLLRELVFAIPQDELIKKFDLAAPKDKPEQARILLRLVDNIGRRPTLPAWRAVVAAVVDERSVIPAEILEEMPDSLVNEVLFHLENLAPARRQEIAARLVDRKIMRGWARWVETVLQDASAPPPSIKLADLDLSRRTNRELKTAILEIKRIPDLYVLDQLYELSFRGPVRKEATAKLSELEDAFIAARPEMREHLMQGLLDSEPAIASRYGQCLFRNYPAVDALMGKAAVQLLMADSHGELLENRQAVGEWILKRAVWNAESREDISAFRSILEKALAKAEKIGATIPTLALWQSAVEKSLLVNAGPCAWEIWNKRSRRRRSKTAE